MKEIALKLIKLQAKIKSDRKTNPDNEEENDKPHSPLKYVSKYAP